MKKTKQQHHHHHHTGYNICMLSDFFYPNCGGVESHIYYLSQCLIRLGHKVIIICSSYNNYKRCGIRYMLNGLKVYYLPLMKFETRFGPTTFNMVYTTLPMFRDVFVREKIDIVHAHQGTSVLGLEGLLHAHLMGIPSVFTDHSLIGFGDLAIIWLNKALKWVLYDCKSLIVCSHVCKENLCLRANIDAEKIYVIPHAVDTNIFKPLDYIRNEKDRNKIIIVIVTRLAERKGADLLLSVIPKVCLLLDNDKIKFVIAGDGDRKIDFDEMIERNNLYNQVEMLGKVENSKIPQILNQGDIFLNASLTEAFCIAILEASACGLYVVATKVGGVPEILPDDMISLCDPNPNDMIEALKIAFVNCKNVDKTKNHKRIGEMYHWDISAKRTEKVYDNVVDTVPNSLVKRMNDHYQLGFFFGKLSCLYMAFCFILLQILKWLKPDDEIDKAIDTRKLYNKNI